VELLTLDDLDHRLVETVPGDPPSYGNLSAGSVSRSFTTALTNWLQRAR
jgi:hypothetical protein